MSTQSEIKSCEDRRYQAMASADLATLDALLSDDLVYCHSNASLDTKASLIQGIKDKKYPYQRFDRLEENIRTYGDCAVVTGHAHIHLLGANGPRMLNLRYTDVWARGAKGWQMVSWQSTLLPA